MSTIRHVVEYYDRAKGRWYCGGIFTSDRKASEQRRAFRLELQLDNDPDPQVRIRMGDPAELLKTMNEGTTP